MVRCSRSAYGPVFDGSVQCLGHHGLEAQVAQRALLLQMRANGGDVLFIDAVAQVMAVGGTALFLRPGHCQEGWMRGDQGIGARSDVGVHARPGIAFRVVDHAGADRIELDVAVDRQQIPLAVDEARLEATLPKRAGSPMAAIERLHVAMADVAHRA